MTSPFFTITDPVGDNQFNWDQLASLLVDTGNRKVGLRSGVATVTWPGGAPAATVLTGVVHGIGRVARVVCSADSGGPPGWVVPQPQNVTATTFDIAARTFDGTIPGAGATQTIYWIAVG